MDTPLKNNMEPENTSKRKRINIYTQATNFWVQNGSFRGDFFVSSSNNNQKLDPSESDFPCFDVFLPYHSHVPGSKVAILGMVIPPFNRNPYNGYINPYYWVDDHPLLYGNDRSLDPGTHWEAAGFRDGTPSSHRFYQGLRIHLSELLPPLLPKSAVSDFFFRRISAFGIPPLLVRRRSSGKQNRGGKPTRFLPGTVKKIQKSAQKICKN